MCMKLSPLQLVRYLVPEISCVANPEYDPDKPRLFDDDSLQVTGGYIELEEDRKPKFTTWTVEFQLKVEPSKTTNIPYSILLKFVGLFRCSTAPADIPTKVFVETNGSSILYGTARELVRHLTSAGPWGQLWLPTLSFSPSVPSAKKKPVLSMKKKKSD